MNFEFEKYLPAYITIEENFKIQNIKENNFIIEKNLNTEEKINIKFNNLEFNLKIIPIKMYENKLKTEYTLYIGID